MKMVRGAIADIEFASQPRSQDNVDDQRHWDKTVSLLTQVFGITPVPQGGMPDVGQRSRLAKAKGKLPRHGGVTVGRDFTSVALSYLYPKVVS